MGRWKSHEHFHFKIKTKEINGKTRAIVETDIERIENLQEEIKDTKS